MSDDVYHVGIDPGWSGGIAILFNGEIVETKNMPDGPLSLWLYLRQLEKSLRETVGQRSAFTRRQVPKDPVRACLEKVAGYIGNAGDPGASMFTFGRNYGAIELCLHALSIPFSNPIATVWQRGVGASIKEKGETKEQHKRKLKQLAQEKFPDANTTLRTADAILLALYSSIM